MNTARLRISRRDFLAGSSATLGTAALGSTELLAQSRNADPMIWAYLLHLGMHFWSDRATPRWREYNPGDTLLCETPFWHEMIDRLARAGCNMVVIDLSEGVQYKSHPELAVKGSWSRTQLREELDRMRKLGIEPIPKLNFSTAHDTWLKEYQRAVSTKRYYEVCSNLIAECMELFDKPRFMHLGMDEETIDHQRDYALAIIRQHELWWHDLDFLAKEVEKGGARPWIWSDYEWHNTAAFYENMPRSILQSNWYYGEEFKPDLDRVSTYDRLDFARYDQIPTGSNWTTPLNFERTVEYCSQRIDRQRLKGFLQTTWVGTFEAARDRHETAIAQLGRARANWNKLSARRPA